eukprot:scaffold306_cov241-Pinguiococcus_pyrenoidosus.AAC.11
MREGWRSRATPTQSRLLDGGISDRFQSEELSAVGAWIGAGPEMTEQGTPLSLNAPSCLPALQQH